MLHRRLFSTKPIIHIPKCSSIYPFGDPSSQRPVLRNVGWTVHEGEAWAVMSASSGEDGKRALFRTLLGYLRVSSGPATGSTEGLYPFLGKAIDPYTRIASVSFSHRSLRSTGGAFYDYTARYGAIRDEDALTLRESMFPESIPEQKPDPFSTHPLKKREQALDDIVQLSGEDKVLFDTLVKEMDLDRLLDLPLVALSNGQTRRARVVKVVLQKPEVLLLDEPLTGLDASSRPKLLYLLKKLHESRKPRVIVGIRTHDDVPDWITHVALVQDGTVSAGHKSEILPLVKHHLSSTPQVPNMRLGDAKVGQTVLDLQGIHIKYGDRVVLKDVNWKVRQGERWHLQGGNGSGKTTLLSLILGDHPQSYTQKHLVLPSLPHSPLSPNLTLNHRKRIPTPNLRQSIGVVSPELFDAFPRRHPGMSVWEAIGTGFEGVFVPLAGGGIGAIEPGQEALREWRTERLWEMLENLGPTSWTSSGHSREIAKKFADSRFTDLSVGEQRMVLLMRALVGRPPVVLLDEVWSGMNENMVAAARKYLRNGVGSDQAVIVITHCEEEVPWSDEDGIKRFRLESGEGVVLS